jgi:cytochrome P450
MLALSGAVGLQGRQVSSSIREAFRHFTTRAATGFIVPEWLPTPDNMQYNGAVHRLDTFVFSLIDARRAELARSAGATASPRDLLDALLLSRDDDGRGMEDGALRDELMTLLVAGQETSAILLGWVSSVLAWHPTSQERAAAEVAVRLCPSLIAAPMSSAAAVPCAASLHSLFCACTLLAACCA